MRTFAIEFSVMKGLGPDWVVKTVGVGIDDLEAELDESQIRDVAIADAREQLRRSGITRYQFRTLYET